ncbi:hypothetical protein [Candidatus Pelagibacter sp. HIMB1509]|uniref:hypothetical protein n=1 Tax=Candidatus Pelagibacter sp. HIMB1509 TaxID=3413339 RepID=UPI003F86FE6E
MNLKLLSHSNIGVCILAYKRLDKLKMCIKSLRKHINKNEKIFIFQDYYDLRANNLTKKQVDNVRNFLVKLNKKKNYEIFLRSKRLGMTLNWFLAYEEMFKKFAKVICLEDDIIVNKNYIKFTKFYLNYFEFNKNIMNITGFSTKIELPKNYCFDCYITKRSMSWGQASWRRVWKKFRSTYQNKNHLSILRNKKNKLKLLEGGEDLLTTMTLDYLKFVDSIQVWWIWNIIKNKGLCINPTNPLSKNIGYDESGTHSKVGENFPLNTFNKKYSKKMKKIYYSDEINNNFYKKFKIKKKTLFLFNYLPINLIKILYQIRRIIR